MPPERVWFCLKNDGILPLNKKEIKTIGVIGAERQQSFGFERQLLWNSFKIYYIA